MLRCLPLVAALSFVGGAAAVPAAEPLKIAQRWALLIGVDDYAYAQKLNYCGADQVALAKQLIAAGVPQDHVFLLHDKAENPKLRPSFANIQRQLNLVLNLADVGDLVIIAFSGHGVHLGSKSYLCPADCTLDKAETLVAVDDVYEQLHECAADFKLVLIDACRNDPRPGGARAAGATDGTRALARSLQELKVPEGVVLLNSCAPGEISWEDEQFGHGVFMHFVLDGLQGAADFGQDGSVSLNELQAYAGTKTKTYVANKYAVPQRPFFKGDLTTEALEYALLPVSGKSSIAAPGKSELPPTTPQPNASPSKQPLPSRFAVRPEITPYQCWIGAPTYYSQRKKLLVVLGVLEGSPAARAGLKVDDVLLAVDEKPISAAADYQSAIDARRPNESVKLRIRRGDAEQTVDVALAALPNDGGNEQILMAAEAGQTWAMVELALRYAAMSTDKPYLEPSERQAVDWMRRAANGGSAQACHFLALWHIEGKRVPKDDAEAVRWLQMARKSPNPNDPLRLDLLIDSMLGESYSQGRGVEQDYARAAELLIPAVAAGDAYGLVPLAYLYCEGKGVAKDEAKAMEMYLTAAKANNDIAEYNVAWMITNGRGVAKDEAAAFGWYERSAKHGNAMARHDVGVCYEYGYGVERDYAKALDYYRQAAQQGLAAAEHALGAAYENGRVVPRDYVQAMQHYQTAAKTGYADSESAIGFLIYNGYGVRQDLATARDWIESAAKKGSPRGMYNYGLLLERGEGGRRDVTEAYQWFRKAADAGLPEAKQKVR